jgi:hypothetical protein
MTILEQTAEKKLLMKSYIRFLNHCRNVDDTFKISKEINRLSNEIINLELMPIKLQIINNEPYFITKKSKINASKK